MESDERLHERLQAGDLAAFDALYERHERRLFAFIESYLREPAESEDVLHETFLEVLRRGTGRFAGGSFKSWLYQVARNRCLNRLRKRSRGERARRTLAATPAPEPGRVDEALERRELGAALADAVARLPGALAETYHLRASGLSHEEMARVLAVPVGTVKSRMHALVRKLKEQMLPWTAR